MIIKVPSPNPRAIIFGRYFHKMNYWIYKKFKINHLIYITIFKFLAFRKRKYILSVPKFLLLSRMEYCIIKTILYRLIINSVFHMPGLHKNRVHWEFQSSFKSLFKNPVKSCPGMKIFLISSSHGRSLLLRIDMQILQWKPLKMVSWLMIAAFLWQT